MIPEIASPPHTCRLTGMLLPSAHRNYPNESPVSSPATSDIPNTARKPMSCLRGSEVKVRRMVLESERTPAAGPPGNAEPQYLSEGRINPFNNRLIKKIPRMKTLYGFSGNLYGQLYEIPCIIYYIIVKLLKPSKNLLLLVKYT